MVEVVVVSAETEEVEAVVEIEEAKTKISLILGVRGTRQTHLGMRAKPIGSLLPKLGNASLLRHVP